MLNNKVLYLIKNMCDYNKYENIKTHALQHSDQFQINKISEQESDQKTKKQNE